jgi:hypothetical protein
MPAGAIGAACGTKPSCSCAASRFSQAFLYGVNREGAAGLGQHLVLFEDHLVLESLQAAPGFAQALLDRTVARDGAGFVVVVGEYRLRVQLVRQARDLVCGAPVAHDQVSSPCTQAGVEFAEAGMDELHAAVVARQAGQDVGVEHERAVDATGAVTLRRAQRMVQRGMVLDAQVTPEPDQRVS